MSEYLLTQFLCVSKTVQVKGLWAIFSDVHTQKPCFTFSKYCKTNIFTDARGRQSDVKLSCLTLQRSFIFNKIIMQCCIQHTVIRWHCINCDLLKVKLHIHTFLWRAWNSLLLLSTKCFLSWNKTSILKSCKQKTNDLFTICHRLSGIFVRLDILRSDIPHAFLNDRENKIHMVARSLSLSRHGSAI